MLHMPSNLFVEHIYINKKMTKRCRKSILCRPRRERCLGGAVFVVLHFRHLRIALSSAEDLRGDSTNSQRLSPNQALHLSCMKGRMPSTKPTGAALSHSPRHRICPPQNPVFRSARQLPRAVWWPNLKKDIYTLLSSQLTPSSSSRFLVRPLVFSEKIVARDPQNLHGPAFLSQCPEDAPQFLQSSLLRSYKGLTVSDQSNATSILPSSQLPRRLLCSHVLRFKRAVSGSRYGHPRAQLVSSLHHHTSPSLRLLGAPAAPTPGAPKHSGTCAPSFPYSSSASPPSGQPLSCCLPWQPPPSIIQA